MVQTNDSGTEIDKVHGSRTGNVYLVNIIPSFIIYSFYQRIVQFHVSASFNWNLFFEFCSWSILRKLWYYNWNIYSIIWSLIFLDVFFEAKHECSFNTCIKLTSFRDFWRFSTPRCNKCQTHLTLHVPRAGVASN